VKLSQPRAWLPCQRRSLRRKCHTCSGGLQDWLQGTGTFVFLTIAQTAQGGPRSYGNPTTYCLTQPSSCSLAVPSEAPRK
jgi:hypothetical protein